jgi:hypothetical protein
MRLPTWAATTIAALFLWAGQAEAQAQPEPRQQRKAKRITHAERQAAADRAKALRAGAKKQAAKTSNQPERKAETPAPAK